MTEPPTQSKTKGEKETVVVVGKESVGKSALVAGLTGTTPTTGNFRGTTVDVERYDSPEYVFVDTGTEKFEALQNPEYQAIEGIKQGNVYGVFPTRDYSINFGTAFANTYYIGTVLYPDRFSDVDPAAKADEIYEQFVGAPVYEDVADSYGQGYGRMDV